MITLVIIILGLCAQPLNEINNVAKGKQLHNVHLSLLTFHFSQPV